MSKDNTPAFPCDLTMYDEKVKINYNGMTLRDYFAAKAMQAMAQKFSHVGDVSRNAYKIADAMLEARK